MAQVKRGSARRFRCRGNWSEEHMKEAIVEVKKGSMSIAKAGEKYGIPVTSIRDWLTGRTSSKKRGPRTVLSKEEENALVDWCLELQRNGHTITFDVLRRRVADICHGRQTPFKNGVPGQSWMDWFRKRHPNVPLEAAHALKGKKRTDAERELLARESLMVPAEVMDASGEEASIKRDLFEAPDPVDGGFKGVAEDIVAREGALVKGDASEAAGPSKACLIGPAEDGVDRGEESSLRRVLFEAGDGEPSRMEPHEAGDIMPNLMQQELLVDGHLPTANRMDGINGAMSLWKVQERSEGGEASSETAGSGSFPSSTSSGGRRRWTEFVEGIAGVESAIRESEDRKDRRLERKLEAKDRQLQCHLEAKDRHLERQLESNERLATSLIGAIGQVSESLWTLASRGLGGRGTGEL